MVPVPASAPGPKATSLPLAWRSPARWSGPCRSAGFDWRGAGRRGGVGGRPPPGWNPCRSRRRHDFGSITIQTLGGGIYPAPLSSGWAAPLPAASPAAITARRRFYGVRGSRCPVQLRRLRSRSPWPGATDATPAVETGCQFVRTVRAGLMSFATPRAAPGLTRHFVDSRENRTSMFGKCCSAFCCRCFGGRARRV